VALPPGAKARLFMARGGTAEAVPFHGTICEIRATKKAPILEGCGSGLLGASVLVKER
jgi:hypothetical protein